MSILIDRDTRVIVQGATGRDGSFHSRKMKEDGTGIVGGVTPGRGGSKLDSIPIFDSVLEAKKATDANVSIIFVPARFASSAMIEALDAGIPLVVCITEGVPVLDMVGIYHLAHSRSAVLIGPNCPGLISPGLCKVGIMPAPIHRQGSIGVISRSGTLTYEVVNTLSNAGMGQSTCVGIGGDPVVGTGYIELLERFEADRNTEAVVLIGEIGGDAEEKAADFVREKMTKPVVAFISGRSAPEGKQMGHAGAIISGGQGTAAAKEAAFKIAGVMVADTPSEIPKLVSSQLGR